MKLKLLVDDVPLQIILAAYIPSNPISNSICWELLENGDFSTKIVTSPWIGYYKFPLMGVQLDLDSRYYAKI